MRLKKVLTLILCVTSVSGLITACGVPSKQGTPKHYSLEKSNSQKDKKDKKESVEIAVTNQFYYYDGKVISDDEYKKLPESVKNKELQWFFDASCSGCAALDQLTKDIVNKASTDKKAVIDFVPIDFVHPTEDGSGYGEIVGGYILGIAKYSGHLVKPFMDKVMEPNFQSKNREANKEELADIVKGIFFDIGGTQENWDKINKDINEFVNRVRENGVRFVRDPQIDELTKTTSMGGQGYFVPFVIVKHNNNVIDLSKFTDISSVNEEFKKILEE